MKILFIYNHEYPDKWKDGLYAALKLIEKEHTLTWHNIAKKNIIDDMGNFQDYDFVLGWGGFNSPVDNAIQLLQQLSTIKAKFGLCLAGNAFPFKQQKYDIIFYETDWTRKWLIVSKETKKKLPIMRHAFGYNSDYYYSPFNHTDIEKLIDWLTVGAFATWKRQSKILKKDGIKMAIGEIQKDNMSESMGIIGPLMMGNVIISDMLPPETLAELYRLSRNVYIPADIYGGGERAVLEAQACGCNVEVEDDNPKLKELLGQKWNEYYYKDQLIEGIKQVL